MNDTSIVKALCDRKEKSNYYSVDAVRGVCKHGHKRSVMSPNDAVRTGQLLR
jgi:hypothetical protein